jgi:high-affinity nickel-transport protein
MRTRLIILFGLLAAANLAAWAAAFVVFRDQPLLLGTALLAWSFGLRHAVDADHIAAIDNVTRKLRQDGRRPLTVGLFFALGHSTVVMLAAAGVAAFASLLAGRVADLKEIGFIGTILSALFLFAIAAVNLVTFRQTWRAWRHGGTTPAPPLDGGLLARICRPLFGLIKQPWHMYPLGFLFGLGFDTATEVSLLGLSATGAAQGMPIWAILVFPALFAAGMALVDTADGVLMLGAYDWAFARPRTKLAYNLVITGASVVVAVGVGGLELLGVELGNIGFAIVAFFALAWAAAVAITRVKPVDAQAD